MNGESHNTLPRGKANKVVPLAIVLIVAFAAAAPFLLVNRGKDLIAWRSDLAAAQVEAKSAGKPLLLYFTADWCGPCQAMKRTVFSAEKVKAALEGGFIPVKMDMTVTGPAQQAWSREYGLSGIPTMAVIKADGTRVTQVAGGGWQEDAFLDFLSEASRRAQQ